MALSLRSDLLDNFVNFRRLDAPHFTEQKAKTDSGLRTGGVSGSVWNSSDQMGLSPKASPQAKRLAQSNSSSKTSRSGPGRPKLFKSSSAVEFQRPGQTIGPNWASLQQAKKLKGNFNVGIRGRPRSSSPVKAAGGRRMLLRSSSPSELTGQIYGRNQCSASDAKKVHSSFNTGARSKQQSSKHSKTPRAGPGRPALLRSSSAPESQRPRQLCGRNWGHGFGLHSATRAFSRQYPQVASPSKTICGEEQSGSSFISSGETSPVFSGSLIKRSRSLLSGASNFSSPANKTIHSEEQSSSSFTASVDTSPVTSGSLINRNRNLLSRASNSSSPANAWRSPKGSAARRRPLGKPTSVTRSVLGSTEHRKWASAAFQKLDLDGDGTLVTCELRSGAFMDTLHDCFDGDVPSSAIDAMVDFAVSEADRDSDGFVSLEEFQAFTWKLKRMEFDTDLECDFVFSVFDSSKNETLNLQDFTKLLTFHGYEAMEAEVSSEAARLFSEIDVNLDGLISKAEYQNWCTARVHGFSQAKRAAHFDWAARAFADLDQDGNGYLVACEMRSGVFLDKMRECFRKTLSDDVLHPVVDFVIDTANSRTHGQLSLLDFQALTWRLRRMDTDVDLEAEFVFSVFGRRGSGTLDASQLQQLLDFHKDGGFAHPSSPSSAGELMPQIDADGNGEITMAEYKEWTLRRSSTLGQFVKPRMSIITDSDAAAGPNQADGMQSPLSFLTSPSKSCLGEEHAFSYQTPKKGPKNADAKKDFVGGSSLAKRSLQGSTEHRRWASRAFQRLDLDGDGSLVTCELRSGAFMETLRDCFDGDVPDSAVDAIVDFVVREADRDSDGFVSLEEFQAFTWKLKRMEFDTDLECDFVFSVFDSSKNGTMNLRNFTKLLTFHGYEEMETETPGEAARLFSEIDLNADGLISKAEYQDWCAARVHGFSQAKRAAHFHWAARAFAELDQDGDGYLAACDMLNGVFLDKMRECFRKSLSDDVLHPVVDFVIDTANSKLHGKLCLREFQALTWRLRRMDTDVDLEAEFVFSVFARHGNGTLDANQFQQLLDFHQDGGLAYPSSPSSAGKLMPEIDADGNGEITMAEYKEWTLRRSSTLGKFASPMLNTIRSMTDPVAQH